MSKSARTIFVWSFYVLVVGASLSLFPNTVLSLLGIAETEEVWIRVVGIALILLSLYYWDAARNEAKHLFLASLLGRGFVAASYVVLWVGDGPWQLLIFGAVELIGLTWTYTALRSEANPA